MQAININASLLSNLKVKYGKSDYFNYPTKHELKQIKNSGDLRSSEWYEINQDNRLETYRKLFVDRGYKYLLDASVCGAGKSFNNGYIYADEFNTDYVFIISKSPKNPTTESVENAFTSFPVRHKGLHESSTEVTPTGQPMLFRATKERPANIVGNCSKTNEFRSTFSLEAAQSPCMSCNDSKRCNRESGDGFGYLSEIKEASIENHFRIHANSLRSAFGIFEIINTDQETKEIIPGKHTALVVIDEFDQSIDLTEQVSYSRVEIARFLDYVETYRHKLSLTEALDTVVNFWTDFLVNKNCTQEIPSINDMDLRRLFSVLPSVMWNLHNPNYRIVANLDGDKVEAQGFNWRFFQLLQLDNVQVLIQDATTNVAIIRELFPGVICLHQPYENLDNLEITQVTGISETRSSRSLNCTNKINKLIDHDHQKYGKARTGVIDWKIYPTAELRHLNDARGSNKFVNRNHLIIVGLSKINLGAAKLTHFALNTMVDFSDYYSHQSKAELLQCIGRLRHGRRLDEKLTCTIIANDDLSFLTKLGFKLKKVNYDEYMQLSNKIKPMSIANQIKVLNGKKDGFNTGLYIGRENKTYKLKESILHNPFPITGGYTRNDVITYYEDFLNKQIKQKTKIYDELLKLAKDYNNGKEINLVCWCKPQACHGDIIKKKVIEIAKNL